MPGHGEIREEPIAIPSAHEVLVRTKYSGISRGTEALVFNGRVPPSEYARMRAPFQSGNFPGPVKYGYASVGRVESGPEDLQGRDVFVLYPHQTSFVVPAAVVHRLPDGVPAARAILAANLETAINGSVGRATSCRRSHCGGGRRDGRLSGGLACLAHRRLSRRARRCESFASANRGGA